MSSASSSVHTLLSAGAVLLTVAGFFSERAFRSFVLVPGNSLLLGEHNLWSFLTAHFVSPSWALLALHASLVAALGLRSESPAGPHTPARVAATALYALTAAGIGSYALRLSLFVGSGNEEALYKPVAGCGPLAAVAAVLAAQALGDAPVHEATAIPASQVPLVLLLLSALTTNAGVTADAAPTLMATVAAWGYLRFFAAHGDASAPRGDARDAFEFLSFLPGPLRVACRPLEKMGSALILPFVLRAARGVAGAAGVAHDVASAARAAGGEDGGVAALIYGVGGVGGGAGAGGFLAASPGGGPVGAGARIPASLTAAAADPVAERRRVKALESLDKRLAELKEKLRGGAPVASSPAPVLVV